MSKLKITLAASFLVILVGCGETKTPSTQQTSSPSVSSNTPQVTNPSSPVISTGTPQSVSPSPSTSPTAIVPNATQPGKNQLISTEGIGPAKVGMSLGELKRALEGKAEFKAKSPFIVDFDAIAISQAGKDQFYILYPAGAPMADTDIIEALVTDNPAYRTAQGVGPGTSIKQAEAVYGDATLSYNTQNESREYVEFANQPSQDISFRTKPLQNQQLAGTYPSSKAELKETKNFPETATIGRIEVYCRQNCPLPLPGS